MTPPIYPAPDVVADDAPPGDETLVTEITIQPDGRVYVFGASRQVLEVLAAVEPNDPALNRLLGHVRAAEARSPE